MLVFALACSVCSVCPAARLTIIQQLARQRVEIALGGGRRVQAWRAVPWLGFGSVGRILEWMEDCERFLGEERARELEFLFGAADSSGEDHHHHRHGVSPGELYARIVRAFALVCGMNSEEFKEQHRHFIEIARSRLDAGGWMLPGEAGAWPRGGSPLSALACSDIL